MILLSMKKFTNEQKQTTRTFENDLNFVRTVSRCNFGDTIGVAEQKLAFLNNNDCYVLGVVE